MNPTGQEHIGVRARALTLSRFRRNAHWKELPHRANLADRGRPASSARQESLFSVRTMGWP